VYAAKTKYADNPSFREAMHGEDQEKYLEAMKVDIAALLQKRIWKYVPSQDSSHVINSTWDLKLKRLPDGTPSK
jgi:hypothetical protein